MKTVLTAWEEHIIHLIMRSRISSPVPQGRWSEPLRAFQTDTVLLMAPSCFQEVISIWVNPWFLTIPNRIRWRYGSRLIQALQLACTLLWPERLALGTTTFISTLMTKGCILSTGGKEVPKATLLWLTALTLKNTTHTGTIFWSPMMPSPESSPCMKMVSLKPPKLPSMMFLEHKTVPCSWEEAFQLELLPCPITFSAAWMISGSITVCWNPQKSLYWQRTYCQTA